MQWSVVKRTAEGSETSKPYASLIRAIDAFDRAVASGEFIYVAIMEAGKEQPFTEMVSK